MVNAVVAGRITRSAKTGRKAGSGRPLGFLGAFLLHEGCSCALEHKLRSKQGFTLEERRAGRAYVLGLQGHEVVFRHEDGGTSQPEDYGREPEDFDPS